MFPCRRDYLITLSRGAGGFGPLGPTGLRPSRYTFRLRRLGSVLSGLDVHRFLPVLQCRLPGKGSLMNHHHLGFEVGVVKQVDRRVQQLIILAFAAETLTSATALSGCCMFPCRGDYLITPFGGRGLRAAWPYELAL